MSKNREQNETPSFSDEQVRLYLLCRLNDDERVKFEERLLVDDELADRARLAEFELTDDYAAGRLNPTERGFFENKFLVTEGRRNKLRVSRALREHAETLAAPTEKKTPAWRETLSSLFSFNRSPVFATAGTLALLLLFAGAVLFIVRQAGEDEPLIATGQASPTPQAKVDPAVQPSPAQSSPVQPAPSPTPNTGKKPSPLPTSEETQAPATVATFVLFPGALRGEGELLRVAVPEGKHDLVRLVLVPEVDGQGVYSARLLTADEETVLVRNRLKVVNENSGARVLLNVPAPLLRVGDYQVKLSRQLNGVTESVGSYRFRALQK